MYTSSPGAQKSSFEMYVHWPLRGLPAFQGHGTFK